MSRKSLESIRQYCIRNSFFVTGAIQDCVADIIKVSNPTVCRTVHRVAMAITDTMKAQFLTWPGPEERYEIMQSFQQMANFPFVLGLIDCTHVRIIRPKGRHPEYVDRNNHYSINVQVSNSRR